MGDGTGTISEEEFKALLEEKDTELRFSALQIDMHQARCLFALLDVEMKGEIDIESFILGCLRLRGTARAVDMTTLIYEHKRFAALWQRHATMLETAVLSICPESRNL